MNDLYFERWERRNLNVNDNETKDFTGLRMTVRDAWDLGCNAKDRNHEQKRIDESRENSIAKREGQK